jgi:hypothetical protein
MQVNTCAMLSEAHGGEAMKEPSVLVWHKQFKECRMSKSQMKTMLNTFFDIKGIVHFEFIPLGQTVGQTCYMQILKRLHESVNRERPELWSNDWIIHYDNAPAHKALSVKQVLTQKSIIEMEHPPYSPNLVLGLP